MNSGWAGPAAGGEEALTVQAALLLVQDALDECLGALWLKGEVFEYRGPYRGSGHYYFKLRDAAAQLDVILWAGRAARALGCELAEGRQVLAHGSFEIYPRTGRLSFLLDRIEDFGAGELARRFAELKRRLEQEGLFDAARKRPLPARPRAVALITAVPSAAAADLLRTWQERAAPFAVWLRPCRVQGAGAAAELARALAEAARARPSVVVLARGGGSLEDLWAFNEEELVRAVAASPVPVLCAVGHETDVTLCDFAADERAKTPTAAAHRLLEGWEEGRGQVGSLAVELEEAGRAWLEEVGGRLRERSRDLREQRPDRRLERLGNALRQAHAGLVLAAEKWTAGGRAGLATLGLRLRGAAPRQRAADLQRRAALAGERLRAAAEQRLARGQGRLAAAAGRLEAASPEAVLRRGFALVEVAGRPGFLRRAGDVAPGERLRVLLAQGVLTARVEQVVEGGPEPAGREGWAAPGERRE